MKTTKQLATEMLDALQLIDKLSKALDAIALKEEDSDIKEDLSDLSGECWDQLPAGRIKQLEYLIIEL